MKNLLFVFSILILWSCKSNKKTSPLLQLSSDHKIIFLDSLAASEAIIIDEKEKFFAFVNKLDMGIQMKKNFAPEISREDAVKEYKAFLKTVVLDFTKEEIQFLNEVMKESYEASKKVSPNIFPKEIKLIKTNGNQYGEGAYYTRENCILIPKDQLTALDSKAIIGTIFHEISHIYTRYNTDKRKQLYKLIGFSNIGNPTNILIKEILRNRILLNPDGINYAYKINLTNSNGSTSPAIPIIFSKENKYQSSKKTFFAHLDFSLFKINTRHAVTVLTNEEGKSTVSPSDMENFFQQITDNTNYIIHPDEIIADNFMYIMMREIKNGMQRSFSEEGEKLLEDIKKILVE